MKTPQVCTGMNKGKKSQIILRVDLFPLFFSPFFSSSCIGAGNSEVGIMEFSLHDSRHCIHSTVTPSRASRFLSKDLMEQQVTSISSGGYSRELRRGQSTENCNHHCLMPLASPKDPDYHIAPNKK